MHVRHITTVVVALLIFCNVGLAGDDDNAASLPDESPLRPFAFLLGSCWTATFPDGKNMDTHCYTAMLNGHYVRDRHYVHGDNSDYRGETIYHFDANENRIVYRYWNSVGGISDGSAIPADDGIDFPAEMHVRDDGSTTEIRSRLAKISNEVYVMVSEEKSDNAWKELWKMEYKVGTAATEANPARDQ